MTTHSEKRFLPYTPEEMYALVADIESYPKFLPWCSGARIRSRTKTDSVEEISADLVISFKVFREKFGSHVTLRPEETKIDVKYLDGPFRYLDNHWQFAPHPEGCEVDFYVDFEFKSSVLQALIGVVFNEAMLRIVNAFEQRAQLLYGQNKKAAPKDGLS